MTLEEKSLEYLEYKEQNGEIMITGYRGNPTEFSIPLSMGGLLVTAIELE